MKIFFYWKWGAVLKLKTSRNYYTYEGFTSSGYLALYAKVFLVISTIYSTAFVIQGSFLWNWDKIKALL